MIMNPIISGTSLPELTTPATEGQILTGRQAIDQNGEILTGSMPEITVPNPTISVSNSGLITASSAYSSGHTNGGTASNTYQLTTQAARTITPSRSSQTAVASGRYTTGNITVAGDSDLIASNIKSGVNIFGVTGNYSGEEIVTEQPNITFSGRTITVTTTQNIKTVLGLHIYLFQSDESGIFIAYPDSIYNGRVTYGYYYTDSSWGSIVSTQSVSPTISNNTMVFNINRTPSSAPQYNNVICYIPQ